MPTQTTATKSSRINLRLTPAQEEKLRYVAASSQTSLSDFVLASALDRADRVLADQTEFTADDDAFDHLLEALDTPLPTTRIRALASRPSPVGSTLTWTHSDSPRWSLLDGWSATIDAEISRVATTS